MNLIKIIKNSNLISWFFLVNFSLCISCLWCLYVIFCINSLVTGFSVLGSFKKFSADKIRDDSFISLAGSIGAFFGGLRFQWGPLVDRFSFKWVYLSILITQIILGSTFPSFAVFHKSSFFVYLCLIICLEAGHFTLMPIMITKLFGAKAQIIYPFAFSFSGVASLLIAFLSEIVLQGDFEVMYYASAGLNIVSLLILVFVYEEKVLVNWFQLITDYQF